ncbi:MAG: PQQ-binding-like beta-propeller repeat protein [Candidatus Thalassarchaeaceae archaeon]|nr:PQQ-binding-like beta-propeller repeat protein [Candidatus Thalassarchaeaceae archaeon]
MRRALLIFALFLLASIPAEASEGRHAEWVDDPVLPDVQWNASVDIGYISTAPLVKDGLVIVKGGGDPMTGEGAGMAAYRADTGVEIWRTIHSDSERGFETAPLLHVPRNSGTVSCSPSADLIITGWTSGHLSAYDFTTGTEVWNQSTEAPNWGISGGGFALTTGKIVWPTETGTIVVCADNGTILRQYHDSDLRTYRANLGIWFDWGSDENGTITTSLGWLQGTESGHLLRYDNESTLLDDVDIVALANLSGTWRIRSTPISMSGQGVMVHLHADGESRLIRMDWNESGVPELLDSIPMGPGTATTPAGLGYLSAVAGSSDAVHFGILNGSIFETIRWNATNVVGEIRWLQWGEVNAICLPQNSADGSWYIAIDANHSVEWTPDQSGYLTAGCGSDGEVHAAANDASWLEVRYNPIDWNSIHNMADETLGTTDEPGPSESDDDDSKSTAKESSSGIIWLPIIGAGILAIVAQFSVNSETRRQIRMGAVLMVMFGLVMAGTIYNTQIVSEPNADSSQRHRVAMLLPELNEGLAENEALIAFHFPESFAPEGCNEGNILDLETDESWQIESPPDGSYCIVISTIIVEAGNTVESVTISTLNEFQYTYDIEQQMLGVFLLDVGLAEGGTDGRWWSYDLNGGYGAIGMGEQGIETGDHIDWHFDAGQF